MQPQTKIQTKHFYRTVAALALPIALQNLINVGVQAADVVMLGLVGEDVLSAASLAGQVQFVMMLFFFGIGSGASVLTAQYWGKGDIRSIEKILSISLRLSMAVALLFFLLASFIPETLMRIFTTDPVLIAEGVVYLRIVAWGYLFTGFSNIYLILMRSIERVVVSTVVYAISLVANVILNAVLIFGLLGFPAMGIAGAAIATMLARLLELIITVVYAGRNPVVRIKAKDYTTWHGPLLGDFRRYAGPTILNEFMWGLAVSANTVIIGHLGSAAVAANSVAQVMRQLATVVSFGLASSAAVLIGKALGAGDGDKAQLYAKKMLRLSLFAGIAGAGLILLSRPFVVRAMNLSALANDYLLFLLLVLSVYVLFQSQAATMIVGIFRGGGDIRAGLAIDIGVMWCFTIPFAALAAFVFGWPVQAVYLIIMSDEIIKVPIAFLRYRQRKWLRNVTR